MQLTHGIPNKRKSKLKVNGSSKDVLSDYVFGKVQPQNIELECAVLGGMMLDKDCIEVVLEILKPDFFYVDAHRLIYDAIVRLHSKMHPVDLLTVTEELKKAGDLESIGGGYYLVELTNRIGSSANIEYHSRIVHQKHIRRTVIKISADLIRMAYDDTVDVFDLLDEAETSILDAADFGSDYSSTAQVASKGLAELEKWTKLKEGEISGVDTGFDELNDLTGGWQPTDLIILAARPGMGKTGAVVSIALSEAEKGIPVGIFTCEVSDLQLLWRLVGANQEISMRNFLRGKANEREWMLLGAGMESVSNLPIFIDETPSITIHELRSKAKRMVKKDGVKAIYIDYLQLMSGVKDYKGNKEQEVADISKALKGLAKELNVPVIALSQLSRAVESRGGSKRPQLSDLRNSGAVEQDADMVIFIYRPEYYQILEDEDGNSLKGVAEFIVAKHRHGPTDTIKLKYTEQFAKFENLETDDPFAVEFDDFPEPDSATASVLVTRPSKTNDDEDIPF